MRTQLKKPTIFQIIKYSLLVSLFTSQKKLAKNPKKIGKYTLVRPLAKSPGTIANFTLGVYALGGQKFFGKTWHGKSQDLSYFTLINEYRVCSMLYKKLRNLHCRLRVPRPLLIQERKNSLSVLFEYIDCPDASSFPLKRQAFFYKTVLEDLQTISRMLSADEKKIFTRRGFLFYLASLPFLLMLSFTSHPTFFPRVVRALTRMLLAIRFNPEFTLSHRDLRAPNMKVGREHIYLLDSEDMTLTIDGFDLADVNILLQNQSRSKIAVTMDSPNEVFFKNYIAIHRSNNPLQDDRYKNYLLSIT